MRVPLRWNLLLALTIPVSSLLGLARAMKEGGAGTFWDVWAANAWGDVAFAVGTVAAGYGVHRILTRTRLTGAGLLVAAPAALLMHWVVYAISWSLTAAAFFDDASFWSFGFTGFAETWRFTWTWGWIGLVSMGLLSPALAWAMRKGLVTGVQRLDGPGEPS